MIVKAYILIYEYASCIATLHTDRKMPMAVNHMRPVWSMIPTMMPLSASAISP